MTMAPTTTRETLADVVSRNIRTLMALRGISQIRLADEVGISQTGVSKRLRGVTPFDLNDLERIAQVLDVRPIDLLNADLLKLPRRDSNLQPAGSMSDLVSAAFGGELGAEILPFAKPIPHLPRRPVCTRPGGGSSEYPLLKVG